MKHLIILSSILLLTGSLNAQENMTLPYVEIPEPPEDYRGGNVLARMIDGLGYRYYWATEGLRPEDLSYQISETNRTTDETLDHILGLSKTILNTANNEPNMRPAKEEALSFEEKRKQTLHNLKEASEIFKNQYMYSLENHEIIFQRGDKKASFPIWNLVNGPIADAIWHTGQVVAFRRASGNPLDPRVNVFKGKTQ